MDHIAGAEASVNSHSKKANNKISLTVKMEPDGGTVRLDGRAAWMMKQLITAGKRGVTTIELPTGVRVSHYILLIRRAGFVVSSPRESHGGPFPSSHSRYKLETAVSVLDDMVQAV